MEQPFLSWRIIQQRNGHQTGGDYRDHGSDGRCRRAVPRQGKRTGGLLATETCVLGGALIFCSSKTVPGDRRSALIFWTLSRTGSEPVRTCNGPVRCVWADLSWISGHGGRTQGVHGDPSTAPAAVLETFLLVRSRSAPFDTLERGHCYIQRYPIK